MTRRVEGDAMDLIGYSMQSAAGRTALNTIDRMERAERPSAPWPPMKNKLRNRMKYGILVVLQQTK